MSARNSITLSLLLGWALSVTPGSQPASAEAARKDRLRLHVVFNNLAHDPTLTTGWGFACLVEGPQQTVLFDTGGDGRILLANLQRLGLDAMPVDAVVLSHVHGDHTGGLEAFVGRNPNLTVYMPASFPSAMQQRVLQLGARLETVTGPRRLLGRRYWTTGVMGALPEEQALIVDTPRGLVVITGCAHADVAEMAERAQTLLGKAIYLLLGGFHLGGRSEAGIGRVIERLQAMGVRKVAPSHCTGDTAIRMFRAAWGADFVEGGLGAVIEIR